MSADIDSILRSEAEARLRCHSNKEIGRETGLTPKQVSNRLRKFVRELADANCSTASELKRKNDGRSIA